MTRPAGATRTGATLLELLVVLAILSVVAGIAPLAFQGEPAPAPDTLQHAQQIAARARQRALREGRTVRTDVLLRSPHDSAARRIYIVGLPDGSVIADSVLAMDRLAGAPALRDREPGTPEATR